MSSHVQTFQGRQGHPFSASLSGTPHLTTQQYKGWRGRGDNHADPCPQQLMSLVCGKDTETVDTGWAQSVGMSPSP